MNFYEFKLQLIESIILIKSGIQKIIEPMAKSENLTAIQFYILFNLDNGNINTVGGLSKEFGVNQGNISTLCKDLEKAGLIKRIRNIHDERIVNIELTVKGKKVIKRLNKRIDELKKYFKDISDESINLIVKGIKEFSELLKDVERKV